MEGLRWLGKGVKVGWMRREPVQGAEFNTAH